MSAFTNPVIVTSSGTSVLLERIPLSDGDFLERWLQKSLFANPQCLPASEISAKAGDLIPICMELETGAGPADILFVTAGGQIVLVETKLWRNPEARREVVAQILDYAKQLACWSYEDLAREVSRATGEGPGHLLARVLQCKADLDQAAFVDGVNRSLKTGDFLLLIVGDGIRSGAEALVGFLERYGNLRFDLGLIEVAAYRLPDGNTLLQPRVLAKTEVIERTVLLGPTGPLEFEQVATADDAAAKANPQAQWFQFFWAEYLAALTLDDQTQPKPQNPAKSTNLFLPMPPGGASAWVSAYLAQSLGKAGVYLTFAKTFGRAGEYYERLLADREEIESIIGLPLEWVRDGSKYSIAAPAFKIGDLNSKGPRQQVIAELTDMTNRFVNAFRHRLEAYLREATQLS